MLGKYKCYHAPGGGKTRHKHGGNMIIQFDEISLKGRKSGICPKCGERAKRSFKFYQTLSIFNKNKNGFVKTEKEIMEENTKAYLKWAKTPTYHAKCED